jgi:hypothetical protein
MFSFKLYAFFCLNLVKVAIELRIVEIDFFGGHMVSNDDASMSTLNNELQLF